MRNVTGFDAGTIFNGGVVNTITLATDGSGDIYAGGAFTSYDGTDVNRLTRLGSVGQMR